MILKKTLKKSRKNKEKGERSKEERGGEREEMIMLERFAQSQYYLTRSASLGFVFMLCLQPQAVVILKPLQYLL
jgi:hypothetical protein